MAMTRLGFLLLTRERPVAALCQCMLTHAAPIAALSLSDPQDKLVAAMTCGASSADAASASSSEAQHRFWMDVLTHLAAIAREQERNGQGISLSSSHLRLACWVSFLFYFLLAFLLFILSGHQPFPFPCSLTWLSFLHPIFGAGCSCVNGDSLFLAEPGQEDQESDDEHDARKARWGPYSALLAVTATDCHRFSNYWFSQCAHIFLWDSGNHSLKKHVFTRRTALSSCWRISGRRRTNLDSVRHTRVRDLLLLSIFIALIFFLFRVSHSQKSSYCIFEMRSRRLGLDWCNGNGIFASDGARIPAHRRAVERGLFLRHGCRPVVAAAPASDAADA